MLRRIQTPIDLIVAVPPSPFRRGPSGEIELRQGGMLLLLVIGVPFVLIGVYLALGSIGLVPVHDEFGKAVSPAATFIACLCFLVIGCIFAFGRHRVVFDVARRSVLRQYSVLVPIRTEERRMSEFDAVTIVFWKGNSDSPDRFSVQLRAPGGKNFKVCSSTDQSRSREQAAFLANALSLPLAE